MREVPGDENARRDEDGSARDSLAGDLARKLDPDIEEPDSGKSGADPEEAP